MIEIYHNPRCRKSREALKLLESKKIEHQVVLYLDTALTENQLTNLINKLGMTPAQIVRKNEALWKDQFKDKDLSSKAIIKAMVENPKLIERPIIVNAERAVIGRPAENILTLLKN